MKKLNITKVFLLFCLFNQLLYTKTPYTFRKKHIIYEATYGRTLTIKWPPVPHPCPRDLRHRSNKINTPYHPYQQPPCD